MFVERAAIAGHAGVAGALELGHQLGVEFLFDGGVFRNARDVFDLVGVALQNKQLLARAFSESVIVMPFPLRFIAMLHEPRFGGARVEVAEGDKGVVRQRVEI